MSFVPLREKGRETVVTVQPPAATDPRVAAARNIRIVVKQAGGVALLPLQDVECLEADGNVVVVQTASGEKHRIRESLSHMFEQLNGYGFIRVHRGTIVSATAIVAIEKGRYRKAYCVLRNGGRVEIGRVEFQRLRLLWQTGVLDLSALSAGLRLLPHTS